MVHLSYTSSSWFFRLPPRRLRIFVPIMADQYRGRTRLSGQRTQRLPCLIIWFPKESLFTNAVSSYPVSSPARAMLETGIKFPCIIKVKVTAPKQRLYGVELYRRPGCWSDVQKDMNYRTGYIENGIWILLTNLYVDTYNNRGSSVERMVSARTPPMDLNTR